MRTMRAVLATVAVCAMAANAELYGIAPNVALQSISPTSGNATSIGSPVSYEDQAQGLSSIDPERKTYFLLGFNRSSTKANLVGLDLASGSVTTDIQLPFAESAFVGVGQTIDVDPKDGNVFVGGRLAADGPHVVGKLDIQTGKFTQIAALNASLIPVLGAASTFDTDSRQMFVQLASKATGQILNFAVDVETKAVTVIPDSEGHIITTMAYDSKRKVVVGLGVKPSGGNIQRTIVELNPASKTITTVATVQGWLIESGGESAFDASTRTLYWIGQATDAKPTDPFSLVGLNADTGAVKTHPELCPNDASCPWSIGVL